MAMTLTQKETAVLAALEQNADECSGGDFACAEEVNVEALKLSKQQFGALLTTLQEKGIISVDVTYINGDLRRRTKGEKVTQVTFR